MLPFVESILYTMYPCRDYVQCTLIRDILNALNGVSVTASPTCNRYRYYVIQAIKIVYETGENITAKNSGTQRIHYYFYFLNLYTSNPQTAICRKATRKRLCTVKRVFKCHAYITNNK